MSNQILNHSFKGFLVAQLLLPSSLPPIKQLPRPNNSLFQPRDMRVQLLPGHPFKRLRRRSAQPARDHKIQFRLGRRAFLFPPASVATAGDLLIEGSGGIALKFPPHFRAIAPATIGTAAGGERGGEDELLLLAGGQDLVEVDGHAKGDEEEAPDAGADPVGRLEGRRCDELGPEGCGARGREDGVGGLRGRSGRGRRCRVSCGGEEGIEVVFCRF